MLQLFAKSNLPTDVAEPIHVLGKYSFFDRSKSVCWMIGILMWIFLFILLHFREVRVDMLDVSSTADRYIVAQESFEFFDEETTLLLRQEAVRDIKPIYRVQGHQIQEVRKEIEVHLTKTREWRKLSPQSAFEEMSQILDVFEEFVVKARFTDARTLHQLNRHSLAGPLYFVAHFEEDQLLEELPDEFWEQLEESYQQFPRSAVQFIVKRLSRQEWELEADRKNNEEVVKHLQNQVPDKYSRVQAGRRIIDQGERVTSRHLAMLYAMKTTLNEKRKLWHGKTMIGSAVLSLLLVIAAALLIRFFDLRLACSNRYLMMVLFICVLTAGFGKLTEYFLLKSTSHWMDMVRYPLVVPLAGILLTSLISSTVAMVVCCFLIILLGFSLALESQGMMILNLVASMTAILMTGSLRHRKEVVKVCCYIWISCAGVLFAFNSYEGAIFTVNFLSDLMSSGLFLIATGIFVTGVLPLFESGFHVMTDAALMEYMDPNHPILRRLSMEAPGTYQHSIVVGNLCEAAAVSIGANGLFCRVSALYHDIGKLMHPQYFTENQQGGINMHQLLTPSESTKVILEHVSEGVKIGQKIGLPEQFIDVIRQHHGTTLVFYFFRKQEDMVEEGEEVNEQDFRYQGPKPQTREAAIMMIADSFEAASRSLDKITEETLQELLEKLIEIKAKDGQFDECELTFQDLKQIKKIFIQTLLAGRHERIKYPAEKKAVSQTKSNVFQDS